MRTLRVVSLIASSTEIVHALGAGDLLVGRSHECDFPESVRALPRLTSPKFQTAGTSYAIDQRIKAIVQEGLSVYRVDADELHALRPDVILTQTQCEVCAVSERDVEDALATWTGTRPRIVSLAPSALADVWTDIERVAAALDRADAGRRLIESMTERMARIAASTGALAGKPRVACIEWIDPLMAAGNWMPELVAMAGGADLFGESGKHSPWMTWSDLVAADPDVIFVSPCGFDLATTRREMPQLTARPGWRDLRAVRDGRVVLADGNQYFHRPGPRLVESLEILTEILHPEQAQFAHEGTGWVSWAL